MPGAANEADIGYPLTNGEREERYTFLIIFLRTIFIQLIIIMSYVTIQKEKINTQSVQQTTSRHIRPQGVQPNTVPACVF